MLPPFEHMLRNSVVHGIETPAERAARGKPETGTIAVRLQREGAEVVIVVEDDGAGLDVAAIRAKARQMGLLRPEQSITDEEALQLILEPGFSTADRLTQQAGRGVGMDVVATEVKKLGGGLFIESHPGRGARFTIRLPFTLAITQALIVRVHDELFALPVATVEGVARLPRIEIYASTWTRKRRRFEYGGRSTASSTSACSSAAGRRVLPETDLAVPVILVRAGEHSTALVDRRAASAAARSSSSRSARRSPASVASPAPRSSATVASSSSSTWARWCAPNGARARSTRRCARRATTASSRWSSTTRSPCGASRSACSSATACACMTAKDGVDAMSLLQDHVPDVILLDIEMPRMDGYEVASHVRNDPRLADVPIIMITSRVGDKHRARAIELGVDDYLGKPYQESQLLDAIEPLVLARRQQAY